MKLTQRIGLSYYRIKLKVLELFSLHVAGKAAFELFCTPYSKRKTYEEPHIFKQAEKLSFKYQGYTIHGFKWEPEKKNSCKVLICHGFDSLSYRFERYIEPLLKEGFDVFAFDAPGHGFSSGNTINALIYSGMILEIENIYGKMNGIIAHSFGGIAATLAIEKMKENLPKGLVLIAPATETTRSLNDFCRHLHVSRRLKDEMERLIVRTGGQPSSWYSVARIIESVAVPTLWLHDIKDTITPFDDMKHLLDKKLAHVEFIITEGLGHSLYRDDKVAEQIVAFLAGMKQEKTAEKVFVGEQ